MKELDSNYNLVVAGSNLIINFTDILDYIPFIYDKLFIPNGPTCICASIQNDSLVEDTEFFYAQLMVDGEISTNHGNTTKVFITDANGTYKFVPSKRI